jgi:hypothetical protein
MTDAFRAGAAAPAATAGGREAGVCATNLQQHASSLGLSPDVLQQWVAADMSSMVGFLQQQAAAATTGVQLQEVSGLCN